MTYRRMEIWVLRGDLGSWLCVVEARKVVWWDLPCWQGAEEPVNVEGS